MSVNEWHQTLTARPSMQVKTRLRLPYNYGSNVTNFNVVVSRLLFLLTFVLANWRSLLLLRIWEVPVSDLGSETPTLTEAFRGIRKSLQINFGVVSSVRP